MIGEFEVAKILNGLSMQNKKILAYTEIGMKYPRNSLAEGG